MGCFSVYCEISKITIRSGQNCVLQLIRPNHILYGYLEYIPAILPIYGEYDDYGGIENIKQDDNTKIIESHFKCDIQDFCNYFTNDAEKDDKFKKFEKLENLKNWRVMWIDRKVWDFISSYNQNEKGDFDFGKPYFLKLLGGEYLGEEINETFHDPQRYKHKWKVFGKIFYSDGNWLHTEKDEGIYNFKNSHQSNNLSDYVIIPKKYLWLKYKCKWELYDYYKDSFEEVQNSLLFYFTDKFTDLAIEEFVRKNNYHEKKLKELKLELKKDTVEIKYFDSLKDYRNHVKWQIDYHKKYLNFEKTIASKYVKNWEILAKELVKYNFATMNMRSASTTWTPFVGYVTPQCGELDNHQILLEKFSKINKSYNI
jgi:hypothetical protein